MSSFRSIKIKYDVCRGKDCMKNLINFKKRKMKLLTKEQQELNENAKICYICKEKLKINI